MKNRIMRRDYPVEKIADDTYMISDFGIANCYLLVGEEKALLIDCGLGIGDLKGAVENITDKPLVVAGTHGHVDHVSGDGQFDEIFVPECDCGRNYSFQTSYLLRKAFLLASKGVVDDSIKPKDLVKYEKRAKVVPFQDGKVFDLGGRKVVARHFAGHTLGSTVFLDEQSKIAFVGDDASPSVWLFLPHSASVEKWLEGEKQILALSDDYKLYWGHEKGLLSPQIVQRDIAYGEEILQKRKRNAFFSCVKFFPCNDRVNGSVVFRTGNVREKKGKKRV